MPKHYQNILALVFAVKEINENPIILPNITLGFHILSGYYLAKITYKATLSLLSTHNMFIPNFRCDTQRKLISVIGSRLIETYASMATTLTNYKIPQVRCRHEIEMPTKKSISWDLTFRNGEGSYSMKLTLPSSSNLSLHFKRVLSFEHEELFWTWRIVLNMKNSVSKTPCPPSILTPELMVAISDLSRLKYPCCCLLTQVSEGLSSLHAGCMVVLDTSYSHLCSQIFGLKFWFEVTCFRSRELFCVTDFLSLTD